MTDPEKLAALAERPLLYGLTNKKLFARASEIADQRYPNGCSSATKLAAIVREVIDEARALAKESDNANG